MMIQFKSQQSTLEEPLLPLLVVAQPLPLVYRSPKKRTPPIPRNNCALWKRSFGIALLVGFLAGFCSWVEGRVLPHIRQGILHEIKESEIEPLSKYWQDMNAELLGQQEELQMGIRQLSKRKVTEKFGNGPHRVQIQLAFNPDGPDLQGTGDSFVIELAPIDEMPHSVHWFLEQVDAGLYDGCSFQPSAGHVVMGGAIGNFLSEPDFRPRGRFVESGFPNVLFQEASYFPHLKYSMALAGQPHGGPDFFVSMQDNTLNHAEPCFAKVIDGFETVDRMNQSPEMGADAAHGSDMVAIVSMRIIPSEEAVDDMMISSGL